LKEGEEGNEKGVNENCEILHRLLCSQSGCELHRLLSKQRTVVNEVDIQHTHSVRTE